MFRALTSISFRSVTSFYSTNILAKVIVTLVFVALFVLVAFTVYLFSFVGYKYIFTEALGDLERPLLLFANELVFATIGAMIVVGIIIKAVFRLFKSNGVGTIMASPKYGSLVRFEMWHVFVSTFWMVLVLVVPITFAYLKAFSAPLYAYFVVVCGIAALHFILVVLSFLLILGIGSLGSRVSSLAGSSFTFGAYVKTLIATGAGLLLAVWAVADKANIVGLFKADNADAIVTESMIAQHFMFLPTHFFAQLLSQISSGNVSGAWFTLGHIILIALILSPLVVYFGRTHFSLWRVFQSSPDSGRTLIATRRGRVTFSGNLLQNLFKKELVLLIRNHKAMLFLIFILTIWLTQLIVSSVVRHNVLLHAVDLSGRASSLRALEFGIALYLLMSLAIRFVLPAYSMDKATSWITETAPIEKIKVYHARLLGFCVMFLPIGILMALFSGVVLKMEVYDMVYLTALLVVAVITIVSFTLGVGALFPNDDTDDPDVISTSMQGVLTTMLLMGYGIALATSFYQGIRYDNYLYGAISALLSCVVFVLVTRFALAQQGGVQRENFL